MTSVLSLPDDRPDARPLAALLEGGSGLLEPKPATDGGWDPGPNGFNGGAAARRPGYVWSGEMSMCPKLIVALQIDRAIGVRRYLLGRWPTQAPEVVVVVVV